MKYTETFTSCTNTHVNFDLYLPLILIRYKAIVQIHHGMGEHSGRYQKFAEFLSSEGYVVVVSDFPGHGSSLHNFEKGYFGSGNPRDTLVKDMHRLRGIISLRYPDLPYFILGNQLGSYVLRAYIHRYGDYIEGVILMGTTDKIEKLLLNQSVLALHSVIKGKMHHSKTLKKSWMNQMNAKFAPVKTSVDYLTSDPQEQRKYQEDPLTNFTYTDKSYKDIIKILKEISKNKAINKTPNYLSIYIISGENDIFGRMGKGPKWLYEKYKKHGVRDVEMKLYSDSRHDILHERNRNVVFKDILAWLDARTHL